MDTPAASSPAGEAGAPAGIDLESSPGIIDFQARERRAELLKFACEAAAVGRRYREVHHSLFGVSLRRVLSALQSNRTADYIGLESILDAVQEESRRIEYEMGQCGLENLPRRAKKAIAIRDALPQYVGAVSDAAQELHQICRSLRLEDQGSTEFKDYSTELLRRDRAAYDASVQEIQRWGARLTELTGKL